MANTKQRIRLVKATGLVILVVCAFWLGHLCTSFLSDIVNIGGPHVYSDYLVRQEAEQLVPNLPKTAYDLYFARFGLQDPACFLACSFPDSDFKAARDAVKDLAKGRISDLTVESDDIFKKGPNSWDDQFRDPMWNIGSFGDLVIETTNGLTIAYSPQAKRLFLCAW